MLRGTPLTSDWEEAVADGPNRARTLRFLHAALEVGCRVEIPDAVENDYLNVQPPPPSTRRSRVASVHIRSGHVEFQDRSWDRLNAPAEFTFLAGGRKTRIYLDSDESLALAEGALGREAKWEPGR